jgi:4-hydroxybenzoate polyprenyltransferase
MVPDARAPLIVDLDGTLVATDTLWETLVVFLKGNPLRIFSLARWILLGKAAFKQKIAAAAVLDFGSLPYRAACLAWLREEKAAGRQIWLATGADARVADAIASHLGLFDGIIASDGGKNVTGSRKADRIASALGGGGFDYAGNAMQDLAVWRKSLGAIVVAPDRGVMAALKRHGIVIALHIPAPPVTFRVWRKALRVHQWVKNLLIFTPLLTSHRISDVSGFAHAACGLVIFSLVASSTYLINDLLDLPADRRHATKSARPLAAGLISIPSALCMIFVLLLIAAALSALLPLSAALLVFAYWAATLFYSAVLKTMVMADVIALALFYTARLLYGGLDTGIEISIWTLAFCGFSFFALAAAKRINELAKTNMRAGELLRHRAYRAQDRNALVALAAASLNIAALVLILYINSPQVETLYRHPQLLWTMCVPFLYWFSRILTLANRGALADDPILFAARDRITYIVVAAMAAIAFLAT